MPASTSSQYATHSLRASARNDPGAGGRFGFSPLITLKVARCPLRLSTACPGGFCSGASRSPPKSDNSSRKNDYFGQFPPVVPREKMGCGAGQKSPGRMNLDPGGITAGQRLEISPLWNAPMWSINKILTCIYYLLLPCRAQP